MKAFEAAIENEAEMNEGEVNDELLAMYADVQNDFRRDADDYAWLLRKLLSEADQMAAQAKRFADEAKRKKAAADCLKEHIKEAIETMGEKKVGVFSVCKNGGKQPIELTDEVPEEFLKYKPSTDTDKIREALTKGELKFARLGEKGTHLRVKV